MFKLEKYITADNDILPFTFTIDDPAGNSYIMNPSFPKADPNLKIEKYTRTREQLQMMGYEPENEEELIAKTEEDKNEAVRKQFDKIKQDKADKKDNTITDGKDLNTEEKKAYEEFKDVSNKSKYSEKDTKEMMRKANEINTGIKYSAHKTDFSKPLQATDIEGNT